MGLGGSASAGPRSCRCNLSVALSASLSGQPREQEGEAGRLSPARQQVVGTSGHEGLVGTEVAGASPSLRRPSAGMAGVRVWPWRGPVGPVSRQTCARPARLPLQVPRPPASDLTLSWVFRPVGTVLLLCARPELGGVLLRVRDGGRSPQASKEEGPVSCARGRPAGGGAGPRRGLRAPAVLLGGPWGGRCCQSLPANESWTGSVIANHAVTPPGFVLLEGLIRVPQEVLMPPGRKHRCQYGRMEGWEPETAA